MEKRPSERPSLKKILRYFPEKKCLIGSQCMKIPIKPILFLFLVVVTYAIYHRGFIGIFISAKNF